MVAHADISCCNAAVQQAPPGRATRAPSTSRNNSNKARNGGKKEIKSGRRCVMRKMEALRRLVAPAEEGEEEEKDGVDELLIRAADYIVRLQVQVRAMQLMVDVLEHAKD